MKRLLVFCVATTVVALFSSPVSAALFRDQMNDGTNWGKNSSGTQTSTFNYDYSADAIPEAPHFQVGDDGTRGVKMEANLVTLPNPAAGYFTLYPIGENFTGNYQLRFDAWMNFAIGGVGTTEFIGGGIAYDNVTADIASGAQMMATGEGGSSNDWRAFKSPPQFFIPDADMAAGTHQGSDPYYADFLPSVASPAGQGQAGNSVAGSPGFQWITMEYNVIGNDISIYIEKPDSSRLLIVEYDKTVTDPDALPDGDPGVPDSDGNISLFYADFFSTSVSDMPEFQFGLIDNVEVNRLIPEPTSIALLGLGAMGLVGLGRKRR